MSKKKSIIRVKNPLLGITICHQSASLVMPNGDPRDGLIRKCYECEVMCMSPNTTTVQSSRDRKKIHYSCEGLNIKPKTETKLYNFHRKLKTGVDPQLLVHSAYV